MGRRPILRADEALPVRLKPRRSVLAGLVKSPNRWRWLAHGFNFVAWIQSKRSTRGQSPRFWLAMPTSEGVHPRLLLLSHRPRDWHRSRYGPKVNRVACLPLEAKNEGESRLGNPLETCGGLKVVIE